ncbi:MAG: PEP/pyruvate-binding domain-containing protein [Acutalibacter sp.]
MPISRWLRNSSGLQAVQEVCNLLESHYHDMQDKEFTVENGKLYMLQTRNGKRTPAAAIKPMTLSTRA